MRYIKTKAIIFDMDGVITNTMPDHFRAWRKIFLQEGIQVTHLEIYEREGQKGSQSVREIFAKHGKKIKEGLVKKILTKKEIYFKKIVKKRYIPGARSFLKTLRKNKFRLALVTGTSRHEVYRILPKAIINQFDVIVTGSDVSHGKPHPQPFLKALERLKIPSREAVVLENAPFGITSARRAGLRCLALETSLPKKYLMEAHDIFRSLNDLQRRVKFIKT